MRPNRRARSRPGAHGNRYADRRDITELTLALTSRGVRSSVLRLPPTVHGDGDNEFMKAVVGIARDNGVSGLPRARHPGIQHAHPRPGDWPSLARWLPVARSRVSVLDAGMSSARKARDAIVAGDADNGLHELVVSVAVHRRREPSTDERTPRLVRARVSSVMSRRSAYRFPCAPGRDRARSIRSHLPWVRPPVLEAMTSGRLLAGHCYSARARRAWRSSTSGLTSELRATSPRSAELLAAG